MADKIYKLGLLGCGRFGKNFINTIARLPNMEIAHIGTSNPANAKLFKQKVRVSSMPHEVCMDKRLDGVVICTPPHTHRELIEACFYYMTPFMVEKPMCLSLEDAVYIKNQAEQLMMPCMVDHTQLFNPAFEELVKSYKNNKVTGITSKVHSFGPFRKDINMLWDWLPHDIAMCVRLLKQNPTSVIVNEVSHPNYDNSGQLSVLLKFPGLTAKIEIDNLSKSKYRAFVVDSPYLKMTMFGEELFQVHKDGAKEIKIGCESPLSRVMNIFVEAIETQMQVDITLGYEVVRILESCAVSLANEGEEIFLK